MEYLDGINLKQIEDKISSYEAIRVSDKALETITECTSVTRLRIEWANLTKLPDLSKLTNLTELSLSYNKIADLSQISKIKSLQTLYLTKANGENKVNLPDLNQNTNLKKLEVANSYLTSEDLKNISKLPNITSLNLSGNSIIEVNNLANLTSLTYLNLENNLIRDFSPLDHLTNCTINKANQR